MLSRESEVFALARTDRARYLCALTAPLAKREALVALLAFDQEIARIPGVVSEPMLGAIRLQWWIDALPQITSGQPPGHPIAEALGPLGLSLDELQGLILARNFDLDGGAITFDSLCTYAFATGGAFQAVVLGLLGVDHVEALAAVQDIGAAGTLAGFLREDEPLAEGVDAEQVRQKIQDLLSSAQNRKIPHNVQKTARPALLFARLIKRRVRLGQTANAATAAVVSVWWGKMTGRY